MLSRPIPKDQYVFGRHTFFTRLDFVTAISPPVVAVFALTFSRFPPLPKPVTGVGASASDPAAGRISALPPGLGVQRSPASAETMSPGRPAQNSNERRAPNSGRCRLRCGEWLRERQCCQRLVKLVSGSGLIGCDQVLDMRWRKMRLLGIC
ncbi:hypothetical protein SKAU_G00303840 [Synaphobranchus kaupii]|uniref:Uncharacterized protein n=1 Tax=Synaphobranchus kaupii TaxID=118154 RepID=A0A9Q1EW51_SYNKA|nr:hypothetical protein SKAU_G00303840 [Synaphobranchus kaupii]